MIATQEKKTPRLAMFKKVVLVTLFFLALLGGCECKAAAYGGYLDPSPLRRIYSDEHSPQSYRPQSSSSDRARSRKSRTPLREKAVRDVRDSLEERLKSTLDTLISPRRTSLLGRDMLPVDSSKEAGSASSAEKPVVIKPKCPVASSKRDQKSLSKWSLFGVVGVVWVAWLLYPKNKPQEPRVLILEAPAEDDVVMSEEATPASESSLTVQLFKAILRWGIYKVETYREKHPYEGAKKKVQAMAARRWENFKAKLVQKLKKVTEAALATSEEVEA